MSRTKHHGDRKKEQLFGDNWHWSMGAPKWFSKMTRHRPQRSKRTRAIREVLLVDIADIEDMGEVEWPGDKKPQEYYW